MSGRMVGWAGHNATHLVRELGIPPRELVVDVAAEVLEPAHRERRELLARLVPPRVELLPHRQERHCARITRDCSVSTPGHPRRGGRDRPAPEDGSALRRSSSS